MSNTHPRPSVLWVSPEAAPYASTGGLAEVSGALPRRMHAAGWNVQQLLPYYRTIRTGPFPLPILESISFPLELGGRSFDTHLLRSITPDGSTIRLLACDELYDRAGIYAEDGLDYPDNHVRFGVFAKAACELAKMDKIKILHLHDWTAALAVVFLNTHYRNDRALSDVRVVQSIHNLAHPGCFQTHTLDELGLSREVGLWNLMGYQDEVSWLKGGLLLADAIHTVSPRYAKEILGPEEGRGMDALLRLRSDRLYGILNGIDFTEGDPCCDESLAATFDSENLEGKKACKEAFLQEMDLDGDLLTPLIAFVGRIVPQKGLDLLLDAAPSILAKGVCLVIVGTGDRKLERRCRAMANAYPGQVAVFIGFERDLARRLLAGADMVIMPSRFEPCGLTQMQAMRYGTIPIVHAVGGLADTVRGVTASSLSAGKATGFIFQTATARALSLCVNRALKLFADRRSWTRLMKTAMAQDWSWKSALPRYDELYRSLFEHEPWRFSIELPLPGTPAAPEPAPFIDWGPVLPTRYHEDAIQLMVQSPTKIYVYWEVAPGRARGPLQLRIDREGESWTEAHGLNEVGEYWMDAQPYRHYRARIFDGDGRVLLQSNEVQTPRNEPSPHHDAHWLEAEERRRRHLAARRRLARASGESIPPYAFEEIIAVGGSSSHPHLRWKRGES